MTVHTYACTYVYMHTHTALEPPWNIFYMFCFSNSILLHKNYCKPYKSQTVSKTYSQLIDQIPSKQKDLTCSWKKWQNIEKPTENYKNTELSEKEEKNERKIMKKNVEFTVWKGHTHFWNQLSVTPKLSWICISMQKISLYFLSF